MHVKSISAPLGKERFEHVLVDVGGLAHLNAPNVLAIAF
jgi:hypothetical protein